MEELLVTQQTIFYQKYNKIQEKGNTSDQLVTQISNQRTYYEEIDDKVSKYIDCQDIAHGRVTDLPRLEESIKDIIFGDWDIKMKSTELAIIRAKNWSSNIFDYIKDSLMQANLIQETPKDTIPNINFLNKSWQEISNRKDIDIENLTRLNMEI